MLNFFGFIHVSGALPCVSEQEMLRRSVLQQRRQRTNSRCGAVGRVGGRASKALVGGGVVCVGRAVTWVQITHRNSSQKCFWTSRRLS